MMDLRHLKRLLEIFDSSTATEIQIEEDGIKLKLTKHKKDSTQKATVAQAPVMPMQPEAAQVQPAAGNNTPAEAAEKPPAEAKETDEPADNLHVVRSPIVGTFYRAPSPDSEPFVEVGTHVTPGNTLCIVEAMKLMNEIECDVAGTVEKILIENGKPVEYNQVMFYIRPD